MGGSIKGLKAVRDQGQQQGGSGWEWVRSTDSERPGIKVTSDFSEALRALRDYTQSHEDEGLANCAE